MTLEFNVAAGPSAGRGRPATSPMGARPFSPRSVTRWRQERSSLFPPDGNDVKGADAVVVVVGELPYAETKGDRSDLNLPPADVALVEKVRSAGASVVTVLLSGRPLILGSAMDASNAFIAAWLPGTEGQGVADVLFGNFRPTGKLPRQWPRNNGGLATTGGNPSDTSTLFPNGFSLNN